jgi:HK97 family phage major capsid protein
MNRLQEIEARLAAIANEIETRSAELNAEAITALEAEVKALKEERKALQETAQRRSTLLASIAEGGTPAAVVRSFQQDTTGAGELDRFDTPEYRKAFMNYAVRGTAIPVEYRADATSTTTDVGATIPTTVLNKIVEKLEATGMILPLVTRTAYKGGVAIPVSTAKPTATWVNEGAGSDKQKHTITKEGMITFAYHKLRCAVAVSLEVDNMAISAFEATLINNIVEAMTKAIEQSIISGSGSGQPKGILTETAPTGQALQVTTPAYADLINAEAALPQAYESGAVWCMSKKTFMQYYGLTDTNGQPIGRVNYGIGGKPERSLLGRAVICCDYVTSFASTLDVGTKFAFLFNFKDYVLNTNYNMGIKKYEDNATDDMITKAIMLVDGKAVDINSLVTLSKKA